MAGGSKRAIPDEGTKKGMEGWPTKKVPGRMPGQLGMLAGQLSEGFGMPAQGILKHLEQVYAPMTVHDAKLGGILGQQPAIPQGPVLGGPPPRQGGPVPHPGLGGGGVPAPQPPLTAQHPGMRAPNGMSWEEWSSYR